MLYSSKSLRTEFGNIVFTYFYIFCEESVNSKFKNILLFTMPSNVNFAKLHKSQSALICSSAAKKYGLVYGCCYVKQSVHFSDLFVAYSVTVLIFIA